MSKLLSITYYLLSIICIGSASAQSNAELFAQAGSAYNRGDWQEAIDNYRRILSKGEASASLYYNLANAYYKTEDKAIQNNLKYAQQMALHEIVPLPKLWSQRAMEALSRWNSPNGWGVWAVVSMCLFAGFFFCYYFLEKILYKRIFFTLMVVAFLGSVSSFFLGRTVSHYVHSNHYGILFDKEVRLYEQPNTYSKEVFSLHEGAKVEILDQFKEWYKLKVADGRIGWAKKHSLRKI